MSTVHYGRKRTSQDAEEAAMDNLERRSKLMEKWKPEYEMYPLKYSHLFLGVCASASIIPLLLHYRRFLYLRTTGMFATTSLVVAAPTSLTIGLQDAIVRKELLARPVMCPVCYEIRSTLVQLALAVAMPLVGGPAFSLFLASSYKTEAVPNPRHIAETWAFYKRMHRGLGGRVLFSVSLSVLAPIAAVWLQFGCLEKILEKERNEPVKPRIKPIAIVVNSTDELNSNSVIRRDFDD